MIKKLLTILAVLALGGMAMAQTAPSDINLHRNDDGSWSFIMPGRNLVMSTESFSSNDPNGYTLAGVPEGWLVIAAGDTVTITDGVTTPITEGAPVTIVPSGNRHRIKSITLMEASAPAGLTIDLATVTTDTTVGDGDTLTGTLGAYLKISIADGATVTLDGVTLDGVNNDSYSWAGITCLGDATIILSGTNTVKGFYEEYPGIYVPQNKTLTIEGSGSLTASSNGFGCGIGGGYSKSSGNIVIAGGTITANGGQSQAGIGGGSGQQTSCGTISITGGTITATGGLAGAGIGCGQAASCGTISITGGTVSATGGQSGAGIGSGYYGSCGNITITNGVTSVTATMGNSATHSIGPGKNGSCGTVTVMGAVGEITTSPYTYPAPAVPTIDLATVTEATTVGDGYTLTGTLGASVKISIADGATVTLDGVTINGVGSSNRKWAGITCLGDATIILSGTNMVKGFYSEYPGIYVPENKTLTIQGSGSLTASSNGSGCGIGGGDNKSCGNIVIAGGTITATGGESQAGIGGGNYAECGTITITGGTVNATGGQYAAGIGSGDGGSCGNISITGGTITATGGQYGAGIGSGGEGDCGTISITGGTITATGGQRAAGIGGGNEGTCGTVTITNGVTSLTATKGTMASYSIGAGNGGDCGTITVMGATGPKSESPYTYPEQ